MGPRDEYKPGGPPGCVVRFDVAGSLRDRQCLVARGVHAPHRGRRGNETDGITEVIVRARVSRRGTQERYDRPCRVGPCRRGRHVEHPIDGDRASRLNPGPPTWSPLVSGSRPNGELTAGRMTDEHHPLSQPHSLRDPVLKTLEMVNRCGDIFEGRRPATPSFQAAVLNGPGRQSELQQGAGDRQHRPVVSLGQPTAAMDEHGRRQSPLPLGEGEYAELVAGISPVGRSHGATRTDPGAATGRFLLPTCRQRRGRETCHQQVSAMHSHGRQPTYGYQVRSSRVSVREEHRMLYRDIPMHCGESATAP